MNEDAQLIDRAVTGDAEAYTALVVKYQDRLYGTLARVFGSPEDARDVAQEAFVQVFLKLETFQRQAAFYTWLYRIAFNIGVSLRRKRKPTVSLDCLAQDGQWQLSGDVEPPSARMERREQAGQVHRGLMALSEEHREVIVLRELEGFCYDEIAEVLDIPLGTVRSRLRRARLQLREVLKEVLQQDAP